MNDFIVETDVDHDNFIDIDPDRNFFDSLFSSFNSDRQSSYYSMLAYNNQFINNESLIIIISNVQSLNARLDEFIVFLNSFSYLPGILTLSETWLRESEAHCAVIDGYVGYHSCRPTARGGGVSVYVCEGYASCRIDELCTVDDTIEICTVRVTFRYFELFVLGIYRPHSDNIDNFVNRLSMILNHDVLHGKRIVVLGDLNINLLLQNSQVDYFCMEMYSHAFIPHITKPTRFPPQNANIDPSLLDHIWFNSLLDCQGGIFTLELSDHLPCFLRIPIVGPESDNKIRLSFRSHSAANLHNLLRSLSNVNWGSVLTGDADNRFLTFDKIVNKLYCQCFPLKIKYINRKRLNNPWISSEIMRAIKMKSENFKRYKAGLLSRFQYNRYNNRLESTIRLAKKNFYKSKFESYRDDLRSAWKTIRGILGGKSNRSVRSIIVNGEDIEEDGAIADIFNGYFASVATELDGHLPISVTDPIGYLEGSVLSSMFLNPVTVRELDDIILNLKNESKHGNTLPLNILISCRHILSDIVASLVNNSFESGIFPQLLKRAVVTPVFKSGNSKLTSNYRPISVLPLMSKIYEKCMYNRLVSHLDRHSVCSMGLGREDLLWMLSTA